MGRASDLKRTLLANNTANRDYGRVEFVVLNYNSQDDMHDFMLSSVVAPHIESGIVRYLRTTSPRHYSFPHSRNIAVRHASGDLVVNVDADNFTGPGFASYLGRLACVCPCRAVFARGKRRNHGRVGMYKTEFEAIGGYDEDLTGYGYDDRSLLLRALSSGCTLMWWSGASRRAFAARLPTPKEQTVKHLEAREWRDTERANRRCTLAKLADGRIVANENRIWGHIEGLEAFT
jgi:hypothetical protein